VKRRAACLVVALLGAASLAAQSGAALTADAVVVTVGMTVTVTNDLGFGSVPLGVATTVPITGAGAAAVTVTGSPNAFVSISFTLPAVLNNIQAAPGSTMPISFSATSAGWNRANNNPASATLFDPAVGAVGRIGPPPNPTLYIWLGGTVTPALTAKPGIYTGNIIISLVYT
jgi:hypothetical protein